MKRTNEQIASAGLPVQQLDLDQPIHAQLSRIIEDVSHARGVFVRIDLSEAILKRFARELNDLTPAQRVKAQSMSTVPMEWRWRGVPIRCKRSLPDSCVGVITESLHTRTFRGEIPGGVGE